VVGNPTYLKLNVRLLMSDANNSINRSFQILTEGRQWFPANRDYNFKVLPLYDTVMGQQCCELPDGGGWERKIYEAAFIVLRNDSVRDSIFECPFLKEQPSNIKGIAKYSSIS